MSKFIKFIVSEIRRLRLSTKSLFSISDSLIRINNGKIEPPYSCELNAVDHCNLSCMDCNHASPVVEKRFADPETVLRDFSVLAKVYRPQVVKVIGGEPLLHPNLISVIEAIRSSGICKQILLVTNGLYLPRMPDYFWSIINILEISTYPSFKLDRKILDFCKNRAVQYGVRLNVFHYDKFRITFSIPGHRNAAAVRRIYMNCKFARLWGCHSIHEGYFHKCPKSIYIPQVTGNPDEMRIADSIKISDSPSFFEELYNYLTSHEPLRSCWHCLGSVGKMRRHQQVKPTEWLSRHNIPADLLTDLTKLRLAEMGINVPEYCKQLIEQYSAISSSVDPKRF
jgi:GTP 3',8-cyclase